MSAEPLVLSYPDEPSSVERVHKFSIAMVGGELRIILREGRVVGCEIVMENDPQLRESTDIAVGLLNLCIQHNVPIREIAALAGRIVRTPIAYAIRMVALESGPIL